jgi:hypothetical protein
MALRSKDTGLTDTEYPTTPLLLERVPKKHNVLIGNDPMQIRFAEQFLSAHFTVPIKHEAVACVNDEHVLGKDEPQLLLVERSSLIDLSPNVKAKTGIWSLDLIKPGSAGVNAIVRSAAELMGMEKPDKATVQRVADEIVDGLYDIRAGIWDAAWLLSGPLPEKAKWMRPWENWLLWLPKGVDPRYRLNALYWEMVEWVFAQTGDERGFKKAKGASKFNPRSFQKLSALQLPKDKVFNSLLELSAWRERHYDPYVCALKLAKIWQP